MTTTGRARRGAKSGGLRRGAAPSAPGEPWGAAYGNDRHGFLRARSGETTGRWMLDDRLYVRVGLNVITVRLGWLQG
jgi:hypothetical protein